MTTDKTKPTCGQRMSALGRFVYNSETHQIMGRTAKSWALITLFYAVYYSILAGFFVGMLSVLLFGIIEDTKPLLTGQQSLIRMNPGLGFRPMPDLERTLVRVNVSDTKAIKAMVDSLDKLYNQYSTVNASLEDKKMTYSNCSLFDAQANKDFDPFKQICRLNPKTDWGNCTPANNYGYLSGQPCVVVKMNRIYGWLPNIQEPEKFNHTLMRCEPENDGDKATFGAADPVYYPGVTLNGTNYGVFSSALFPYLKQPGYTTPAVAVQFPNLRRNVLLMIQCRLYNLANSVYSKVDREAMVRFELLIINS